MVRAEHAAAAIEGVLKEPGGFAMTIAEPVQDCSQDACCFERLRVVLAQYSAESVQAVLGQSACLCLFAEFAHRDGESGGPGEGAGVVVAQGATATLQYVLG